jgi:hypothetical protein
MKNPETYYLFAKKSSGFITDCLSIAIRVFPGILPELSGRAV